MADKPDRYVLCVDFDGVLHSYTSGWQGADRVADGPVPGAVAWLRELVLDPKSKFDVQVYSSRSRSEDGREAMREALRLWCIQAGMYPHHAGALVAMLKFPVEKPAAYLTIDDRAICFEGQFPTQDEMLKFKPWYRREEGGGG